MAGAGAGVRRRPDDGLGCRGGVGARRAGEERGEPDRCDRAELGGPPGQAGEPAQAVIACCAGRVWAFHGAKPIGTRVKSWPRTAQRPVSSASGVRDAGEGRARSARRRAGGRWPTCSSRPTARRNPAAGDRHSVPDDRGRSLTRPLPEFGKNPGQRGPQFAFPRRAQDRPGTITEGVCVRESKRGRGLLASGRAGSRRPGRQLDPASGQPVGWPH
jgi:hypothetical protein